MKAPIVVLAALLAAACGGDRTASPTAQSLTDTFPSGDIRLSYALDLPAGNGPFAAVVMGHGSGPSTKDEARFLARRLQDAGFAVLRYDKRGVGASGGTYEGVHVVNSERMLTLLASDMVAGVEVLKTQPNIDPRRIGLMGVSQAGWIMPIAAERSPDVAFMVLVVGPTVSVGTEIFYSRLVEFTTAPLDVAYARTREFQGPHGFDPRPILESLSTPALWLLGGADRSIPTPLCVEVLQSLQDGGHPYRWIVYPGLDHNLGGVDYMADALRFLEPWRR